MTTPPLQLPTSSNPVRRAVSCSLGVVLLIALVSDSSRAQVPDWVRIGGRIRVTLTEGPEPEYIGTLLSREADTVRLRVEDRGDEIAVPMTDIARFDVSQGRKNHTGSGALVGLGVGAMTGMVVGWAQAQDQDAAALLGGGLFGGLGLGLGAIIGSRVLSERWEVVPLDSGPGTGTQQGVAGVAVRITLRL